MPKSVRSYHSFASGHAHDEADDEFPRAARRHVESDIPHNSDSEPPSPLSHFRNRSSRALNQSQYTAGPDETSSLLEHTDGALSMSYRSVAATPRFQRQSSWRGSTRLSRNHSRKGSFSQKLVNALGAQRRDTGQGRSALSGIQQLDEAHSTHFAACPMTFCHRG